MTIKEFKMSLVSAQSEFIKDFVCWMIPRTGWNHPQVVLCMDELKRRGLTLGIEVYGRGKYRNVLRALDEPKVTAV